MDFGIAVLLVIIAIDLVAVFYVFRIGVQHDPHHTIREPESAGSVVALRQQAEETAKRIAARDAALAKQESGEADDGEDAKASGDSSDGDVSSQLGDEDARAKRRAAALARKAARQASSAQTSESD